MRQLHCVMLSFPGFDLAAFLFGILDPLIYIFFFAGKLAFTVVAIVEHLTKRQFEPLKLVLVYLLIHQLALTVPW